MEKLRFISATVMTLEDFLKRYHLSKPNIYKLFSNKLIEVNDQVQNSLYIIKPGDIISINLEGFASQEIKPWKHPLTIIYEDEDLLIVNKPVKLLVHPDGKNEKTLANAVAFYYQINNHHYPARHIHRLDYDTSGIMVFAKHLLAHSFLNYQMETRQFQKKYYALVEGRMKKPSEDINLPIGRNRHLAGIYIVSPTGKEAVTQYQVVEEYDNSSLLAITIKTGRTHQIRVHLSHLGHPIIGDPIYGNANGRLMLHASSVSFLHPRSMELVSYKCPLPKEFER